MKKSSPAPNNVEWIRLETAVELIGQMISNKVSMYTAEQEKDNPNVEIVTRLQAEIAGLGKERRACYQAKTQKAMVDKAHNVYGPLLVQN